MSTEATPEAAPGPTLPQVAVRRGIQSAVQGLAIDVAVAVALVILASLPQATDWAVVQAQAPIMALMVAKSIVQAVAAWVIRRFADQSGYDPQTLEALPQVA